MTKSGTKAVRFNWTEKSTQAALALAQGKTKADIERAYNIPHMTLYRWLANDEFSEEVDRLTLRTGIALRAERMRIAKRVVAQRVDDVMVWSKADLLDWLKFAQSETDGANINILLREKVQQVAEQTGLDFDALLEQAERLAGIRK